MSEHAVAWVQRLTGCCLLSAAPAHHRAQQQRARGVLLPLCLQGVTPWCARACFGAEARAPQVDQDNRKGDIAHLRKKLREVQLLELEDTGDARGCMPRWAG